MEQVILAINPGSTSTKIAIYKNTEIYKATNLHHNTEDLAHFNDIVDQREFRENLILDWLKEEQIELNSLTAIVARGGMLAPLQGGTYAVNKKMTEDLKIGRYGKHASNLAALIAYGLKTRLNLPAYIVDPVVVDEFEDLARVSGLPDWSRRSVFHALNQKASAKKAAETLAKEYEEINLIVAHLGGGISVGSHKKGRVIDVNDALLGEGPLSPERVGGLGTVSFLNYIFGSKQTKAELIRKLAGNSGLVAHLGTNDLRVIEQRVLAGEEKAQKYFSALTYQISKEIGKASGALKGEVDAIVLTGGLAYSKKLVEEVEERVAYLAPLVILPGENELEALALGALRVLNNEEAVLEYFGEGR